ncbi:unnamed protein product, partial [Prorocentrum cordatum]
PRTLSSAAALGRPRGPRSGRTRPARADGRPGPPATAEAERLGMGCQTSSEKQRAADGDVETANGDSPNEGISVVVADTSADKDGPSQEVSGASAAGRAPSSPPKRQRPPATVVPRLASYRRPVQGPVAARRDSAVSKGSSSSLRNGRHKVPKSMSVVKRK